MLDSLSGGTGPIIMLQVDPADDGNRVEYWRLRAAEARTVAEGMLDIIARQTMEGIAASYERLAEWAERRVR